LLKSIIRELEGCVAQTIVEEEEEETEGSQRWFGRPRGSAILLWIPYDSFFSVLGRLMLCNMLREDLE
jgi:hypothetical protein